MINIKINKKINVILFILVILICAILLYVLFNNKHMDIYNKLNDKILKERFNADMPNCMNTKSMMTNCDNIDNIYPIKDNNLDEGCESDEMYNEYSLYMNTIKDVLDSNCFDCDEKKDLIKIAKRVKCRNTI